MPLNASDLARRQWTVELWLRIVSLLFFILMIPSVLLWLVQGLMDGELFSVWNLAPVSFALFCLVASCVLWFLSRRLSVLLVPVPRLNRCPGCGYSIDGLREATCPECGLAFESNRDGSDQSDTEASPRGVRRIERDRQIAEIVFRSAGIYLLITQMYVGFQYVFRAISYVFLDPQSSMFVSGEDIRLNTETVFWLIVACGFLFGSRWAAAFCVPEPKRVQEGD